MSALSDNFAATALKLVNQFGETVTYTRETSAAYNPSTGTNGAITTGTFTGTGCPVDYMSNEINGESVQQGDIKLYVSNTFTNDTASGPPVINDTVTVSSRDYRVMNVMQHAVNGVTVMYELQLRV